MAKPKPYRGLTKESKLVYGWYIKWGRNHFIFDPTIADYAGYDARRRLQLELRRLAEQRRQSK